MIYETDGMELEVVWEPQRGKVNDVVVCRDRKSQSGAMYSMLIIHDRRCAKTMLEVLEEHRQNGHEAVEVARFTQNELLCFVFDYRPDRKFKDFAPGQAISPVAAEEICVNLVMECLSTGLPWPLLYLVLDQEKVNINQDGGIFFDMRLDLTRLSARDSEEHCVSRCGELMMELLENSSRKKLKSVELIRKKTDKHAYAGFPELYRDIKVTSLPTKKAAVKIQAKGIWSRNKDRLFRLLLVLSIVLVIVALIMLTSYLIFGEVPLFRLFQNTFDIIGTENLHEVTR